MRPAIGGALIAAVLAAGSCGPELTVGDVTGRGGNTTGSGAAASGPGAAGSGGASGTAGTTGSGAAASGSGGAAAGSGGASGTAGTTGSGAAASGSGGAVAASGAGGAPACEAKSIDGWAHWPVPADDAGANNYDTSIAGVVKDKTTGLLWQRAVDLVACPKDPGGRCAQKEAAAYCKDLDLAGFCDWRLPSRMELLTIVDYGKYSPAIDETAFPSTPKEYFWSSSVNATGGSSAWYVDFDDGRVDAVVVGNTYRVRCVR